MKLDQLYDEYGMLVYNLALQYVQNIQDAEEITQDVFVAVHQHMEQFYNQSKVSTWVYRITINKSLDFIKYKNRKKRFSFLTSLFKGDGNELKQDVSDFNHPGVILEQKEALSSIFNALNKLPSNQKTVIILSKIEVKTQKEIGEILNISIKAVESLLQRAKNNLKIILTNTEG